MSRSFYPLCLAAACFSGFVPAHAQSTTASVERESALNYVQIDLGIDYSRGKFGETRATDVLSVPFRVKYVTGPFTFRVSLPYVRVSGPGSLVTTTEGRGGGGEDGGHGGGSPGGPGGSGTGHAAGDVIIVPGARARTDSGIGDVIGAVTYTWSAEAARVYVDLTGKVKLPTASVSKRLGTGRTDFVAAVDITKVVGAVSIYGGVRHRFAGRSAAFPLRDTWGASGGLSIAAARSVKLGLDYDWQQSPFRGHLPVSELTASTTFRLTRMLRLQLYATKGLTRNSVDGAGGAQLLWRF